MTAISAAICEQYARGKAGKGKGGRRKYQLHKYDSMRDMVQGEVMEIEADERQTAYYRAMASKYAKAFGVQYSLHRNGNRVTITRTI